MPVKQNKSANASGKSIARRSTTKKPADGSKISSALTILVPVKDEAESLSELIARVTDTCEKNYLQLSEIIIIDDGSTDTSWETITKLAKDNKAVKGIRLRRNFGKATALSIGAKDATGDTIITMDGDLQDDPKEIPRFVEELAKGYDLVSGWKKRRHDPWDKTLPSRIFNKITAWVTGIDLHDFNCGFKAYRREIFDRIELYGELHRFVPVLAESYGYRIGEIVVEHHARKYGISKYGVGRLFKGLLDLVTVVTLTRFSTRPSHLFGGAGLLLLILGTLILLYLSAIKIFGGATIGDRPLLLLGILLEIVGIQLFSCGLLAELIAKYAHKGDGTEKLVSETTG